MIHYVPESLFDSPAQTLVNTVNVVGVMGKGIAKEFKERYPVMFERYRSFCNDGTLQVGKLYLYRSPDKWVLNFPTKKHWRTPSKLEYVEQGLSKFVASYAAHGITSVSFPQLGCGNGGLNWQHQVKPLMERYLSNLPITIFVHIVRPSESFVPEHSNAELGRTSKLAATDVTFFDFVRSLVQAGEPEVGGARELRNALAHSVEHLPDLDVSVPSGGCVTIGGEELASMWWKLRGTGVLTVSALPDRLHAHADTIFRLFLKADYLRPVHPLEAAGKRTMRGVSFAMTSHFAAMTPVLRTPSVA